MKIPKQYFLIPLFAALPGCVQLQEPFKIIWGSSTHALEVARQEAVSKTLRCTLDECFSDVLALTVPPAPKEEEEEGQVKKEPIQGGFGTYGETGSEADAKAGDAKRNLDLFIKDSRKRYLIVMGVPASVNTTEVGIYFVPVTDGVRVEISSLSTNAKLKAAEMVFEELQKKYQLVNEKDAAPAQ